MKPNLSFAALALCFLALFSSCKKDSDAVVAQDKVLNEYATLKANGVVEVRNMPYPATSSLRYNLFNFDSARFVGNGEDSINTSSWHLALGGSIGVKMLPNYGGTAPDYYDVGNDNLAGNASHVTVFGFTDTSFNAVTTAPPAASFYPSYGMDPTNLVWDNETGDLLYMEIPQTRISLFKLDDGRFVKFQYVSIYKDAPKVVTPLIYQNDRGYISLNYFISQKGSSDLTTK